MREALCWSIVWVGLALGFMVAVGFWFGIERGEECLAGFLIEKALAVDNLFVFAVIFSTFAVPPALHASCTFLGDSGGAGHARAFIWLGAALLQQFHWVMYVFGSFLVLTGIKLLLQRKRDPPGTESAVRLFTRLIPSVSHYQGTRFFLRENGHGMLHRCSWSYSLSKQPMSSSRWIPSPPSSRSRTIPLSSTLPTPSPFWACAAVFLIGWGHRQVSLPQGRARACPGLCRCENAAPGSYKIPIEISLLVIIILIGGAVLASLLWPQVQPEERKQEIARAA